MGRIGIFCLGVGLCVAAHAEPAREKPSTSPLLDIEAIAVTPADPTAATLCDLRVKIHNRGKQAASRFTFNVTVNDVPLEAYKNLIYFQTIPPQATAELKLYNFWATESTRPAPADGKLRVKVEIKAAQWVEVSRDANRTEASTPRGLVEGLPVERSLSLQIKPRATG